MMGLLVSARRLRRRTIRLRDRTLGGAGLLPFFGRDGRVERVMLAAPELCAAYLLPWRPGLFRVPPLGAITIDVPLTGLRASADHAMLHGLWHYDPWWVLDTRAFAGVRFATVLKATNCAGRLSRNVRGVYYRRDLSCLRSAGVCEKGEFKWRRWDSDLLPPAATPTCSPTGPRDVSGWCLDPVW